MDNIHIQAQDHSGMWRTYQITINESQQILLRMQEIKNRYPDFRVRAVDDAGRVVDILG